MAKDKYALTTTSKANKDLALLIDEDLQKESELLQKLIKEVYDANQQVKDSHTKRVQETTDRLNALNKEIETLKKDIDEKDHTTTIEQFNYLLKSRDDIFDALNTVRLFNHDFFQNHPIKAQLSSIKESFINILESEQSSKTRLPMLESIEPLVLNYLDEFQKQTMTYFSENFLNHKHYQKILNNDDLDNLMTDLINKYRQVYQEFLDNQSHFFSTSLDDQHIDNKVQSMYQNTVDTMTKKIDEAKANFETNYEIIENEITSLEQDTLNELKKQYQSRLDDEKTMRDNLQDDLKQLRFDIMSAEKRNDQKTLDQLLKTYEKKQKQNLSLFEEKVKRLAETKTKRKRKQLLKTQKDLELKHQEELYKLNLQLEIDKLKFTDSKALFKMREDQRAMEEDQKNLNQLHQQLKKAHQGFADYHNNLLSFIDGMENLFIVQMSKHLKDYFNSLEIIQGLEDALRNVEVSLTKSLQLKTYHSRKFQEKLDTSLKKVSLELVIQNEIRGLLRKKTEEENLGKVEHIRAQEDIKNDLIYQHALIEIADKEYELQLLKIKSLYDNEVNITKSQAERLNIGIGVNETMVKTTVESQMLFAKQQIKFAEKEYDARLENIDYALSQELEYAQEKLRSAEQSYLYDKNTLIKERDAKLEDIAYRLALFTEQKDRKRLKDQEESIKADYQEKIDKIEKAKSEDLNIQRYQKQIDSANKRAEKAKEDALDLKKRTIETFEGLLKQSETKLEEFESQKSKTLVPYIESEASSTAKSRYEEALQEAKNLLNEKIQEPKTTIKNLEERLSELEKAASVDVSAYQEKQALIEEKKATAIEELDKSLAEKLAAIEQEENAFIEKIDKTTEKITSENNVMKNQKTLKLTALNKLKTQEQIYTNKQKQRHQNLEVTKETQLKLVNATITQMQKRLETTINAYKRYLKTTSRSQSDKQKAIQKSLKEDLKNNRTAIEQKY